MLMSVSGVGRPAVVTAPASDLASSPELMAAVLAARPAVASAQQTAVAMVTATSGDGAGFDLYL